MEREKLNPAWIDSLLIYTMLGIRLSVPVWGIVCFMLGLLSGESARNSEGLGGWTCQSWGNVGIIIAIYFYSKRVSHRSMLWTFDKLVVPTGLVAAMIRLGNLMNHEIYGHPTDLLGVSFY